MARRTNRFSIFAQPLDRAVFVAYFLGAVVPLAALFWAAHQWVVPALAARDIPWSAEWVLGAICVLSLASFFALRRAARAAVGRLDTENHRLQALLRAARALAASSNDDEVLHQAAQAAARISGAHAGFHVGREGEDGLRWRASASTDAAIASDPRDPRRAALEEAVEGALDSLAIAIRGVTSREGAAPGGGLAVAVPCATGDRRPGALAVWHDDERPYDPAAAPALATLAAFATVASHNAELHASEHNFFVHVTHMLVSALDAHMGQQADHSRRVARYANRIGRELGLAEKRLERLHFAALLHDIGMLGVDRTRVADRAAVRRHPELGAAMLEPIRLWEDLAPMVRHHHEWFDGSGYPDGKAGAEIPLEARIIAVAETFDALTAEDSYKRPVDSAEAAARIDAATATQFDPEVVRAFLAVRSELGVS